MFGRDALRFVDQLVAAPHAAAEIAFLGFALLCPFPGDRIKRGRDRITDRMIEHDGTLAAVLNIDPRLSKVQDHHNRLLAAAALIGKAGFKPFIGMAEGAERVA